jgi:hypothetical protein
MRCRQEWFGQVAITDRRQEKIRQDGKARKRKQGWLPVVDESAVGVALHASLSVCGLKRTPLQLLIIINMNYTNVNNFLK